MNNGVYLYCVVPSGHEPPTALRGIADLPVVGVAFRDVALWVSRAAEAARPSIEAVQQHNAVVEAAMTETVTPVPLRFGQYIEPAAELESRMADRVAAWVAALADLAGCREYGVRILDPARKAAAQDVHTEAASGGRNYLERLARSAGEDERRRAEAVRIGKDLGASLATLIVRDRIEPLPTTHGVASIAHLVRNDDAPAYRRAVERARETMSSLQFLTTGPWPPYSFVE